MKTQENKHSFPLWSKIAFWITAGLVLFGMGVGGEYLRVIVWRWLGWIN